MGRKAKTSDISSADVLKTAKPSRAHQAVCDWNECPVVQPEILREWLTEVNAMIEDTVRDLISRSDHIGQAANAERLQASSIAIHGLDFLDIADSSEKFLTDDDSDPAVSQAFLAGLRLGMLRERLKSLADGRYKRQWEKEDVGEGAAKILNERYKELQGRYQNEVDILQNFGQPDGLSYEAATKQIAEKYGVSQKTVKDHTENKWPRKGGRPKQKET